MQNIVVIANAVLYCLYATGVCLCCGLLSLRLLAGGGRCTTEPLASREVWADFLLGCGFGPWIIGLLQLFLLIVMAGLPPLLLAGLSLIAVCASLYALRGQAMELAAATRIVLSSGVANRVGALLVVGVLLCVSAFALRAAAIPLWHGDTLIYAYEAKALYDGGSYEARLPHSPVPNAQNYIRNNDHPLSYIGYMESGLSFSPQRGQDLAMRLGLQVQNVVLALVLCGLGLRLRGWVGVLAPLFLLYTNHFGALLDMAHRESFRIIPAMLCLGFLPASLAPLRRGRTALLLAAMTFLWNAHSGSLVVAPLVLGCQWLAVRAWKSRLTLATLFVLGLLLGGNHLLDAALKTGNPLGFEFYPMELARITPPKSWNAALPPKPGLASIAPRFVNQWDNDGPVVVLALCLGLLGVGGLLSRRKEVPPLVLAVAFFCLITEMQVLGLFDWVSTGFGQGLYTVPRYRLVLYPFGALLFAYLLVRLTRRLRGRASVAAAVAGMVLLGGGVFSAVRYWKRTPLAPCLIRDETILDRLAPVKSCWGAVGKAYGGIKGSAAPVILTDSPFIPWYYTDWPVLYLYDPRTDAARFTTRPDTALAELDRLRVGMMVMNKANVLSGSALGVVIESPAFEKTVDCIYDEGYRRTRETPGQ
jgi:hypothetical protein